VPLPGMGSKQITLSSRYCLCSHSTKQLTGIIGQNKAAVIWLPIVDNLMYIIQLKNYRKHFKNDNGNATQCQYKKTLIFYFWKG
jgi:hypothetical protein